MSISSIKQTTRTSHPGILGNDPQTKKLGKVREEAFKITKMC